MASWIGLSPQTWTTLSFGDVFHDLDRLEPNFLSREDEIAANFDYDSDWWPLPEGSFACNNTWCGGIEIDNLTHCGSPCADPAAGGAATADGRACAAWAEQAARTLTAAPAPAESRAAGH